MSTMEDSPRRSPRRRQTLSLAERNSNVDIDNVTMPVTNTDMKAKRRGAYSMGGGGLRLEQQVPGGFHLGTAPDGDGLTPTRRARRSLRPRKSILKPLNADTDETIDFSATQKYAHTIAFSGSLSRRVSFAPNAHVRMFEKDKNPSKGSPSKAEEPFSLPPEATQPRPSQSTPRRSSLANSWPAPKSGARFVEMEDPAGDSDEDYQAGVEMGRNRQPRSSLTQKNGADAGEEEDMDMDMDETQIIYGGIIQGQANGDESYSTADTVDTSMAKSANESQTMDFTIAVGGMLPNSPPVGASKMRSSMGYTVPMSPRTAGTRIHPGEPMDGEADISIEETTVFGGIIAADDSLSTMSEGNSANGVGEQERTMTYSFGNIGVTSAAPSPGMDMTIAMGGIVSQAPLPAVSPARLPTNTRPMSGTPSFARATVSSAQKSRVSPTKRNVFAPSPSPHASRTPVKKGMEAAADVAKRLSFASTTSSGGKKRAREDDENIMGSAKKARPTPPRNAVEAVFGRPSQSPVRPLAGASRLSAPQPPMVERSPIRFSPRKSLGLPPPRRSLGTPSRPTKSPATLRRLMNQTVEDSPEKANGGGEPGDEEVAEWNQPPAVTLNTFLEMAGMQFMDDLPGQSKRRSSVGRGLLALSQGNADREFGLHDYAEAQIHRIFHHMFTWACGQIREEIDIAQEDLDQREKSCAEETPVVIQDYLDASDEDKALFESTFKAFKTNAHLKAKEWWYDWKTGYMTTVKKNVEDELDGMKQDQERLDTIISQTDEMLPELRARAEALELELVKERKVIEEVANCDQGELEDLRVAMAEQNSQVTAFTSEWNEAKAKLDILDDKLAEMIKTKVECEAAVATAKSKCDQFTRSDIIRLKKEYESLQNLHLWKRTIATSSMLQVVFDEEIQMTFDCIDYVPDLLSAKVDLLEKTSKRYRYELSMTDAVFGLFGESMSVLHGMGLDSVPALVQRVGQLWTAAERLRYEFSLMSLHHKLEYEPIDGGVIVKSTLILPSAKSRASLNFHLGPDLLFDWPAGLANVRISSDIIYGSAEDTILSQVASETIGAAGGMGYVSALLQACLEAQTQY